MAVDTQSLRGGSLPAEPALRRGGAEKPVATPWSHRAAFHVSSAVSHSWTFARLIGLLDRLDRRSEHLLVSLMYHRIDTAERAPHLDRGLISASPEEFERQMAFLAGRRPLLSLDDLLAIRRGEKQMPPGAVMVTFDDGYRDFLDYAWPVLERYEIPATLFLPTAYPGRPERTYWWDRVAAAIEVSRPDGYVRSAAGLLDLSTPLSRRDARYAIRDWVWETDHDVAMAGVEDLLATLDPGPDVHAVLDWDDLRALKAKGVAVAGQTHTHPMLNRMPLAQAQEELVCSLEDLRRELGEAPPAFAFPAGGYSDALVDLIHEMGFELSFTTERGGNDLRDIDWLRMRRVNIGCRSSLAMMRAQLLSPVARPDGAAAALLTRYP